MNNHQPLCNLIESIAHDMIESLPSLTDTLCSVERAAAIYQAAHCIEPQDNLREGRYIVGGEKVCMSCHTCSCKTFLRNRAASIEGVEPICLHLFAVVLYDRARYEAEEFAREYEAYDPE